MFGVLVKLDRESKAAKSMLYYLRKLRIPPTIIDESHSTVLRYSRPDTAYQALRAIEVTAHIKGQIIFPI